MRITATPYDALRLWWFGVRLDYWFEKCCSQDGRDDPLYRIELSLAAHRYWGFLDELVAKRT